MMALMYFNKRFAFKNTGQFQILLKTRKIDDQSYFNNNFLFDSFYIQNSTTNGFSCDCCKRHRLRLIRQHSQLDYRRQND